MTSSGRSRPGSPVRRSLSLRLVLSALAWMAVVLVVAWFGLVALFRNHLEADLDARAQFDLNRLIAALEVAEDGSLAVGPRASGRVYAKPYSGRYWQIAYANVGEAPGGEAIGGEPIGGEAADAGAADPAAAGPDAADPGATDPGAADPGTADDGAGEGAATAPLRSRSLWDQNLPLEMPPPDADGISRWRSLGPAGQNLLLLGRRIRLPDSSEEVLAVVGVDRAAIPAAVQAFGWQLGIALAGLALGLAAAIGVQVWFGLAPLRRLRAALGRLRAGEVARLDGPWPGEVAPLVDDLNAVLAHNEAVVGRARSQAGDLAHALKTPIAVLANAAQAGAPDLPALVVQQADGMRRQIDRHLARARAAGAAERPGVRADLGEVLGGLLRAMARLHDRPGLELAAELPPGRALFHGDREDAAEILGCLLENACTWAHGRVQVGLCQAPPEGDGRRRLLLTVDDDGPGLPPEAHDAALARGVRLDESVPGSGLGLAIVRDLVAIYDGRLALEDSPLGGLRVAVQLPGHLEPKAAA